MRHESEKTLDLFRGPGRCEKCHKQCKEREPHHLHARGYGGGHRLDIKINLISLGTWPECSCHLEYHCGAIGLFEMTEIVAMRERQTVDDIDAVICCVQALPPRISPKKQEEHAANWPLTGSALVLFRKVLEEISRK